MTRRQLTLGIMIASVTAVAALTLSARQTTPTTTTPTTAQAGDWFGPGKKPPPSLDDMSEAQLFARMYPELARMDKAVREATPRVLFNGLGPNGKPPMKLPVIIGQGSPYTRVSDQAYRASKPADPWLLVPDERRARMTMVDALQRNASVYLDIESLPLDTRFASAADVDRSVRVIAQTVGWMRAQDPNIRLFFYSGFPAGENYVGMQRATSATTRPGTNGYEWWKANAEKFEVSRDVWRAANAKLRRPPEGTAIAIPALSEMFDGTCPSLYLYPYPELLDTRVAIPAFVREAVNEARLYGKPVYPFVWYLLCDTPQPVPLPQWTTLMREVLTWADGAVLWDGNSKWTNRLALRVQIAKLLAEKHGAMTDAELYDALKADFSGDSELAILRGNSATTQQSP